MSDTQNQWIPVSERLPEDQFTKLVSDGRFQRVAYFSLRAWRDPNALEILTSVTHWMDLPEPPAPPKPADPFEDWVLKKYGSLFSETEGVMRNAWNAAKEHYAKPLPDFETWAREHANGALISLHPEGPYVSYRIAKIIWNAAQGKPEA